MRTGNAWMRTGSSKASYWPTRRRVERKHVVSLSSPKCHVRKDYNLFERFKHHCCEPIHHSLHDSAVPTDVFQLCGCVCPACSSNDVEVDCVLPKPVGMEAHGKKYLIGINNNPKLCLGNPVVPLCGEVEAIGLFPIEIETSASTLGCHIQVCFLQMSDFMGFRNLG